MKLISMTDFVQQTENKSYTKTEKYNIIEWQSKCEAFDKIIKYANFLKQPLTLVMFVPCDDDGNVLEIPNKYTSNLAINDEYEQAKSKVLFNGFKYDYGYLKNENICLNFKLFKTLEDLIPYNLDLAVLF